MLENGTKLDEMYTIVEQIGAGGGGVVYKAYHERLQTYVVVKQIKDHVKELLDGRTEANILKKIKHTYLPRVYDFLEIGGEIYTVMDYIPGESMDKVITKRGRIPAKQVYNWALQLAEAIDYLHRQTPAIIHSDIKPANIMLTPEGNICLIDFNISLAFDQGMRTSTGVSGGYSPPEQYHSYPAYCRMAGTAGMPAKQNEPLAADSTLTLTDETITMVTKNPSEGVSDTASLLSEMAGRGVDERSDVYSLGATLYHLLTGVKPSQNFENLVPLSAYDIGLSEGFGIVINKMMELDPDKRYQNGSELLAALSHVYELDSEYRRYRKKARNQKMIIGGLYIAGVILIGAGAAAIQKEHIAAYSYAVSTAGEMIAAGNYADAEGSIQKAVQVYPNHIGAYQKEVLRLYEMEQYEACVTYAKNVLDNPSIDVKTDADRQIAGDIIYILGNAYFAQGDYLNAANCFKTAISYNGANNLYYRDYAVALAKSGRIDEAEAQLEQAIAYGLSEDSIYFVQGEAAFAGGQYQAAVESFKTCLQITRSETLEKRAVLLCASAYKKMGNDYLDEEIRFLEQRRQADGAGTSMHMEEQLADAYVRKAQSGSGDGAAYYDQALMIFNSLHQGGYATRQIMENIAIIYQQLEDFERAEEILIQMTDQYPQDYRGYKRLAFMEADKQQKVENEERSYQKMKEYYDQAKDLYDQTVNGEDTEMQMLDKLEQDLKEGGWL